MRNFRRKHHEAALGQRLDRSALQVVDRALSVIRLEHSSSYPLMLAARVPIVALHWRLALLSNMV
jgi:hypothetical protein